MKQLLIFVFVSFISLQLCAQECEVKMETIKGKYTGECPDKKAHGKGKSIGTDQYEGDFKNGYPDGIGTYTWQNRDYYTGSWKKGLQDGNGEMHYKVAIGADSIVKGFWKKGKYIGLYEKPYSIEARSPRISKLECRITNKKGRNIFITTHQLLNQPVMGIDATIISITNISVLAGAFYSKNFQVLSNNGLTRLQEVEFPFRAIFYLSNGEQAEILFNEPAEYDVYIGM